MVFFQLLSLLLFFLPSPSTSLPALPSRPSPLRHPHESTALLQFKNSFSKINNSLRFSVCAEQFGIGNPNSTMSWNMSRDCCTWSGVTCDEVTGHVIRLELGCSGLRGIIHSNNSLFLLTHLQTLILSQNSLYGSEISPQFGRFVSLTHIDLSYSYFSGQVPLEFSYLSRLITLKLGPNNDLILGTFSLKRIVANLTSLRELSLSGVNMSFVSRNSFMNLSETLISLDLSDTEMKGEFPANIFLLPNLEVLTLSYNYNLTGSFPRYNWTSPLRNLSLSSTRLLIDLPYLTKSLKYLNHLDARNCNFSVSFPAFLGNITQIISLDLSSNSFGGQIPWDSLNLEKLNSLDLSYNNFEGQLPPICSNSTKKIFLCDSSESDKLVGTLPLNLKSVNLSGNLLNGTLPSWLYSLPSLQTLILDENQFTGVIHLEQFSRLKKLKSLSLSFNSLSVDSINSITYVLPNTLRYLQLSSCNITGFPYSLRSLKNLRYLDLSNNRIDGSVPQWLWNVGKDSLFQLDISHNLLTHIGKIPWKSLLYIDLSSNRLQGHLPIPPPLTYLFSISNNRLVGEIPSFFCNLTWIEVLDLSNNSLSGNIPPCIGNFSRIFVLDLRMNKFCGMILPTFAKGNILRNLNLNGNQLEGPLPQSLVNCELLEILDVGNNKLNGSFPHWLESLPELQVLILRSNRLSGPLSNPKVRFPFQKLRIVDISNNDFTGTLPAKYFENFAAMIDAHSERLEYMGEQDLGQSYYSVTVTIKGFDRELVKIQKLFITIDFSSNSFTGEIPTVIGKLNSLKGLNFSHNKLSGHIPPSLGNLSNLEWLDLSSNELFGNIPMQLATGLYQLARLNLSDNKLEGPIPRGRQFNTFSNDSCSENVGLCGFPLSKSCSNDGAQHDQGGDDDGDHNNGMIDWKVVMMGYGSGMVIGISVGYMVLFSRSFNYWFHKRFGGGRRRKTSARLRRRRRSN
ncbi:receptor-like protein Cf-9 homolog [Morus notabilis]|uniref:receptor-like protein Cf-9 homolog n=1 Tax=Morus notabilis TaxID=981085 RepID=UPI000CECF719|nr:receptor-like protein Cf-9 homolog [Morus notabilis]